MIRVGINGFGRIGRCALKLINQMNNVEVVLINNKTGVEQLSYLYKYDSVYRTNPEMVEYDKDNLIVNGKPIRVTNEEDPRNIPWKEYNVDVVLECTGAFTSIEKCMAHLDAGAKRVIISAPSKDDAKTIVYGVNEKILTRDDKIISAASCTTNCLAPVLDLLHKNYKVQRGFMSTVHAMTNDQATIDGTHKKGSASRRGRAAGLNIIPTSTGAASAIGNVIPDLAGKLEGSSFRVPVGDGSLIDLTVDVESVVDAEMVNKLFKSSVSEVFGVTEDPIVSSDIINNIHGCVVDLALTKVVDDHMIKVVAWYDNEMGYTAQMLRTLLYFCKL